jgi:hypothetical protein
MPENRYDYRVTCFKIRKMWRDEGISTAGTVHYDQDLLARTEEELSCGSEIWTLKQRDIRRLRTAATIFVRLKAGYSLSHSRRNEDCQNLKQTH